MNIVKSENPVICGVEILTDESGRYSLNMLHRASGLGEHKAPNRWQRTNMASDLIEELETQTADLQSGCIEVQRGGKNPGIWAHELLAVSYAGWISPQFQLQVNQVFLNYHKGGLQPVQEVPANPLAGFDLPQNYSEAMRLAADLLDQNDELENKLDGFEKLFDIDGSECVTTVAKVLKMKPGILFEWLKANHWIFQRRGSRFKEGYQDKVNAGYLTHRIRTKKDGRTVFKMVPQVRVTEKGIGRLAELQQADKQRNGQSHLKLVS